MDPHPDNYTIEINPCTFEMQIGKLLEGLTKGFDGKT